MPHRQTTPASDPERLLQEMYQELRDLAASYLRRERDGHTLCTTDLVHEGYLRLAASSNLTICGRNHYLALAAQAMRRVLVDYARRRAAQKRGGSYLRVTFHEPRVGAGTADEGFEVLALHHALHDLSEHDAEAAQIVVLRYFGGLTEKETAEVVGKSERTVRYQWAHARAWLHRALSPAT